VLVVDDEPFNLEIVAEYLEAEGLELVDAGDGAEAWEILERAGEDDFDLLILDRMMPGMDGIELLRLVKGEQRFRHVPVIIQTAAATPEQIREGIAAGAYYYLTKPYDGEMLRTVTRAALADRAAWRSMVAAAREETGSLAMLTEGRFEMRTLDEARRLASALATQFPDPAAAGLGLLELMVNAVEHGNLGISTAEKARLLQSGTWEAEVRHRLSLPANAAKRVRVELHRDATSLTVLVSDDGPGFDWARFRELDPARAFEPNGRGIALARQLCFPDMEFIGRGTAVRVMVQLKQAGEAPLVPAGQGVPA
jgi:CheY-like chemotaxis protein